MVAYTALTTANAPAVSAGKYTLTNSNLTITTTNASGSQLYNDSPQSSGSYYFEATLVNLGANNWLMMGIGNVAAIGNGLVFNDGANHACVIYASGNEVYINGHTPVSFGSVPTGAVVSVAVALPNLIWFAVNGGEWNNSSTANPATGVGGVALNNSTGLGAIAAPFNVVACPAGNGGEITFNFGQTAYAYPSLIPELFSNWPPPETIILDPVSSVIGTGNLSLTGTASSALTAGIDYSIDNSATWTAATGFTGSIEFSAVGPSFNAYTNEDIMVRDHANTYVISNSENFTAGPAPAGSPVFFDNFESYSDLADMEAAGWQFSYNTSNFPNYNPIATPEGCSSNWLCMSGVGTATNIGNGRAFHSWGTGVSKFTLSFDLAALGSTLDSFFNGAIYLGYSPDNVLADMTIPLTITFAPNTAFTSYTTTVETQNTTGTITNVKHHFDISYDLTQTPCLFELSVDGTQLLSGTLSGSDGATQGLSINAFQMYNDNAAAMQIDNLGIYDTGQSISLSAASASYGQRVALSGLFSSGYNPTGLQYQVSGTGTWASVLTYNENSDGSWTGFGPIANSFTPKTIQVRDASDTNIVSNTVTFEAQNGVFVWNDVTIN